MNYLCHQHDIVRRHIPLMDSGAIFERHETEAEISNQTELVNDSALCYGYRKNTDEV